MFKKIIMWIVKFVYKVSGLKFLVSAVESMVLNYRLRLRIVPTSYKLFLVALGAVGSYGWNSAYTLYGEQIGHTIVIEQPLKIREAEAQTIKPVEEWKKAEFSAYTASSDETDGTPLIMASGKMVYVGALACPRDMKLGTRIEIRGVGEFVCEDRMNARYTEHFDIFKVTKGEAISFGRKILEYRVDN